VAVGNKTVKKIDDMLNRFDTIPACDGQTDEQTDRRADISRQYSPRYS